MNWLSIAVIVFLAVMAGYGAKRGLVRMIMSFAAVLLSLLIVSVIYEPLEDMVREQTSIYETIEQGIGGYVEQGIGEAANHIASGTQELIDSLMLPGILKKSLQEGNTPGNYREMGVSTVTEYVTRWLTDLVFSALIYTGAFILVRLILWALTIVLDRMMRLPVLKQINSLAGALLGVAVAFVMLWIGGLIVTAGAAADWGQAALQMIRESALLSAIYNHNYLISGILMK